MLVRIVNDPPKLELHPVLPIAWSNWRERDEALNKRWQEVQSAGDWKLCCLCLQSFFRQWF